MAFSFSGMAQFVKNFAEPSDPEYAMPIQKGETPVSFVYSEYWFIILL